MKPTPETVPARRPCSRRAFCGAATAVGGVVLLSGSGCLFESGGGGGRPQPTDGGAHDLANGSHDMATHPGDSGQSSPDLTMQGQTCPGGVNCGPASAIGAESARHFTDNNNYDIYVCRDGGGLYAMDAACTHAGCTVRLVGGPQFDCPCHGATFDFNGQNPTAPAFSPLQHYALCVDGSGNVIVDYNTPVDPSTRT